MRLYEILTENHRADLYHGTTLRRAEKIVSSNILYASTPVHDPMIAAKHGSKGTVSLTRSIATATELAGSYDDAKVVFVLDGSKLQQNMGKKMHPYDDQSTQWYRDELARYGQSHRLDPSKAPRSQNKGTEQEEAIFGSIKNINSYIKQIIIYYDRESDGDNAEEDKQTLLKSPLIHDPRVKFAGRDSQYNKTSRGMKSTLSNNGPIA